MEQQYREHKKEYQLQVLPEKWRKFLLKWFYRDIRTIGEVFILMLFLIAIIMITGIKDKIGPNSFLTTFLILLIILIAFGSWREISTGRYKKRLGIAFTVKKSGSTVKWSKE